MANICVSLVLNSDTGEFYWQPNSLLSVVPKKDVIIHKCDIYPTKRDDEYLEALLDKFAEKTLDIENILTNNKKAWIISAYEELVNPDNRIVVRSVNPIYSSVHFEPGVRQGEIDAVYNKASKYLEELKDDEDTCGVAREYQADIRCIAEKPKGLKVNKNGNDSYCPCCCEFVASSEWVSMEKYCSNCGQKLIS